MGRNVIHNHGTEHGDISFLCPSKAISKPKWNYWINKMRYFNPLNADLIPICHLLTLLGANHILQVSRIRVKWPFSMMYLLKETNSIDSNQMPKEKHEDNSTGKIVLVFWTLSEWGRMKNKRKIQGCRGYATFIRRLEVENFRLCIFTGNVRSTFRSRQTGEKYERWELQKITC
jgi:hypothetical protein